MNVPTTPSPSITQIQSTVADVFDIHLTDLTGKRKFSEYAFPRHVAMHLARANTNASFPQIARAFGNRDHTTVMYAHSKIAKMLKQTPADKTLMAKLAEINSRLFYPNPANTNTVTSTPANAVR